MAARQRKVNESFKRYRANLLNEEWANRKKMNRIYPLWDSRRGTAICDGRGGYLPFRLNRQ